MNRRRWIPVSGLWHSDPRFRRRSVEEGDKDVPPGVCNPRFRVGVEEGDKDVPLLVLKRWFFHG